MLLAALSPATALRAHGDDQLLIEALTEELGKAPDADLFIRRGELYRHHQEWAKAEADLIAAAKLDPSLALVDFFRARLLLEAGAPEKARAFLEHYLEQTPNEAEGWFLRAEIAHALGEREAAASHYTEGIRRSPSPRPDHFLRRARLLASIPQVEPAKVLAAIEVELQAGNYDGALARIARGMENMPRRERWLVRQGDVLVKAGRVKDAIVSYRAALSAIEELPERYRETVPMEKLAADVRKSLQQLSSD